MRCFTTFDVVAVFCVALWCAESFFACLLLKGVTGAKCFDGRCVTCVTDVHSHHLPTLPPPCKALHDQHKMMNDQGVSHHGDVLCPSLHKFPEARHTIRVSTLVRRLLKMAVRPDLSKSVRMIAGVMALIAVSNQRR